MSEATQYLFNFKELAEMMIKKQGINEGLWSIYVKFGINAANVGFGGSDFFPTAVVPIMEIGIQKQDEMTPLAVDASVVNPSTKKAADKKK